MKDNEDSDEDAANKVEETLKRDKKTTTTTN
jgi:hypothetical protein